MTHTADSSSSPWSLRSRPARRWEMLPQSPETAERLRRECGFPPLVSKLLAARGFESADEVDAFLNPALSRTHDPFRMKDMDVAVERILAAIRGGEPIVVFGDYDVDGITSTALLKSAFDFLRVPARTQIPNRLTDGYGLLPESVRALARGGTKLIVTVDNGTTAFDACDAARELGVDVVVTDHHEPGDRLPSAVATINPKRADCEYPFKELCGVGVAFKLAHALLKRAAPDAAAAKEFLKSLLDFVAVGTIADVVPLVGENRAYVSHGLNLVREGRRLGFRSLMEIAGIQPHALSATSVAFTIAPRLNAAGRTRQADYALDLLLCDEPNRARDLASKLERFNEDRRAIESDITAEALALIDEDSDAPVIVLEQEGWHLGVIGIVASRILDRYHRPVVVLGVDGESAKGSARSISGFDMHAALDACGEHLETYGGHKMAAGLRLRRSEVEAFRESIGAHARSVLSAEMLAPRLKIDAEAEPRELTLRAAEAIARMEPFGAGNPKPTVAVGGLSLVESPRPIKERHLKLRLTDGEGSTVSGIGFGMAEREAEANAAGSGMRVAGTPFLNEWNGQKRLEIELRDFVPDRPAGRA